MALRVGGVPEHFNLPWHIALEGGRFEDPVEWVMCPGGTGAMMEGLANETLDVVLALTEGVTQKCAQNPKLKIIGVYVESPLRWGIHTGAQSPVTTVSDLASKSFAISRYTSGSHLMTAVLAQQEGWAKLPNFEVVQNLAGAQQALTDETAHGFLWEKTTTQPLVDSGVFRRVGIIAPPWPAFVIVSHVDVIEKRRDELSRVLATVSATCRELEADRLRTVALAMERHGLSQEAADEWFDNLKWADKFEHCPDEPIDAAVQTLRSLSMLEETVSSRDIFAKCT